MKETVSVCVDTNGSLSDEIKQICAAYNISEKPYEMLSIDFVSFLKEASNIEPISIINQDGILQLSHPYDF